jgi:ABC-2 type transport system ATP-binding protein
MRRWVERRLRWEARLGELEAQAGSAGEQVTVNTAISVRSLAKEYNGHRALAGVSFEVAAGEVFALLGPNGAGKTTTVEILEGFRAPSAGTARVLGFDPAGQPLGLRKRIGVVLQECGFPARIRVDELLDGWRAYYDRPLPLDDLLEVVELSDQRSTIIRQLSSGQRRRLDLAMALAGDPQLVFLDEPTTGFDPEARRRCWTAVENLRRLGKTIVLTTHYLDEAARLADRVAILARGVITAMGTPLELSRQARIPARISFQLPDAVREGVVRLPIPEASREGDAVVVMSEDPAVTLRSLFSWTTHHGLADLKELSVTPPSLEEAYLALVAAEG